MSRKDAIIEIKNIIKTLNAEQIEDKKILREPHDGNTWQVMTRTWRRASKITHYLNFYNELRGKEFRHATTKYEPWYSKNSKKEIQEYRNLIK